MNTDFPRIFTPDSTGHWTMGTVKTEWLDDGRSMRLLRDLVYVDRYGVSWHAFVGDVIDGASIPRFFWRVIGSPYGDLYRRASVIHDVYCKRRSRSSVRVHEVFHEIMLHDGVWSPKASAMWSGVRLFGPRFNAGEGMKV